MRRPHPLIERLHRAKTGGAALVGLFRPGPRLFSHWRARVFAQLRHLKGSCCGGGALVLLAPTRPRPGLRTILDGQDTVADGNVIVRRQTHDHSADLLATMS